MGEVVPIGDSRALADAILRVLRNPDAYRRPRAEIAARFDTRATVEGHERLFERLRAEISARG